MQELELPTWLSPLNPYEIKDLFEDPRRELSAQVTNRLAGGPGTGVLNPADQVGNIQEPEHLSLEQIEDLQQLKLALDEWWNGLPADVQQGLLSPRPGGRVEGKYREYIETVDPEFALSGQDPRGPVMPPNHIRGYLKLVAKH
ncbi:hypothetical protein GGC64_006003 [Mycobacterium sp. OAS707]|uniref:hypothetical protein n=1 Tax=Mycobacterium sp. OAS707 TaxID=2663822 RepID=UPI00178BFE0A|nr:hypothetical protein [Mycobacterium sp. OAS707]MBE1551916.1 hypothetical protein [Mycobacterium sp. OAS707]